MLTVCAFPHTRNKGLPYCTPTWEPGGRSGGGCSWLWCGGCQLSDMRWCSCGGGGWIRNAENENRRLILRPEKATQQICVFKVLSIVDTHPCELTVSFTPQLVTVFILFRVTYWWEGDMTTGWPKFHHVTRLPLVAPVTFWAMQNCS